jgi:trigger factor
MEFRVEEVAPCRKRVTVTVPPDRVAQEMDAQFKEINKGIALPGFRPGHAPRRVLEARFGTRVAEEAKQKIVEAAYEKLLEEKKVAPLARPEVDVEKAKVEVGKPFEFSFEVTTRPEFDLPEWKGLEVKVPPIRVSDADVDGAIERMLLSEGTLGPAEGGLKDDDVAVLDWAAKEGDTSLDGGESAYYRVGTGVLEGIVAEGLDAALAGKTAGATGTLKGRAAGDDARTPLAGKEFDLAWTLTDVKRFRAADLDTAFLKRHDFDDADELKKDVRRRLVRARERERDKVAEDRLVDDLVHKSRIPLPESVVEQAVAGWVERKRVEGQAQGMSEEDVTKDVTEGQDAVRRRVEEDLRKHFVLEKICEAEDVKVTEQEILGAVEQIARDNGRPSGEVAAWFQQEPGRLLELRSHLRHEKARELVRKAASVVEEATAPAAKGAEPASHSAGEPKGKPKKGK